MNIRQSIFNYYCARQAKRNAAYPNYNRVVSILLLYESEWQERNPQIHTIVQQLHEQNKQVVCWGYCDKDKVLSANLPDNRVLGRRDFNWLFKPKSDVMTFLQRHHFDVLIDLTTTPIIPMQYIALFTNAQFKIGVHTAENIYDMVVQPTTDVSPEYIFGQIIHYMKIIKSAD